MIVDAIRRGPSLRADDVVLDVARGTGPLGNGFVAECTALHGVLRR